MHFSIKDVALASPLHTVPLDALSTLSLLLASGSLYRRGPYSNHRRSLIDGKSLQRPRALQNDLEYSLELSGYDLLLHLGGRAP